MRNIYKLIIFLAVLAFLTPIGLIAQGDAWGEWSYEEFNKMLGFIPSGLRHFSDVWSAPFGDYAIKGLSDTTGYILSAFIGIILIFGLVYIFGKTLSKK